MDSQPDPQPPLDPRPVVDRHPAPATVPDWGDVFTCAMAACTGQPNCPWSPYTCKLIAGES